MKTTSSMHTPPGLTGADSVCTPSSFGRRQKAGGFSLVETVLSLGVVAFAFLPLLALLPMGMSTFRKAMDASVTAQISQRIVNEAQETDFATYIATTPSVRYFDDEGEELTASGAVPVGAIYQVNVHVTCSPTLPGADAANENLATVTIQIANNPGNVQMQTDSNSLWVAPTNGSVSLVDYSTVIAGNNVSSTN